MTEDPLCAVGPTLPLPYRHVYRHAPPWDRCGTLGGNSTTDNVTYRQMLNIKRVAHHLV